MRGPGPAAGTAGRSTRTRSFGTVNDRSHPIRCAITVVGIVGFARNNSRIAGSNPSADGLVSAGVRSERYAPDLFSLRCCRVRCWAQRSGALSLSGQGCKSVGDERATSPGGTSRPPTQKAAIADV